MTQQQDNDQQQQVYDEGDLRKHYSQLPHIAHMELDVYESKVYWHYKYKCGTNPLCDETERTSADTCKMTRPRFREARDSLAAKGYIRIVQKGTPDSPGHKGQSTIIALEDVWAKNFVKFSSEEKVRRMGELIPEHLRPAQNTPKPPKEVTGTKTDPSGTDEIPDEVTGTKTDPLKSLGGTKSTPHGYEIDPEQDLDSSSERQRLPGADAAGGTSEDEVPEREEDEAALIGNQGASDDQYNTPEFKAILAKQKAAAFPVESPTANLPSHPMVQFYMDKTGVSKPTPAMQKLFVDDITLYDADHNRITVKGGLVHQWNTTMGFDEFVKQRIPQMLAMKKPLNEIDLLKHLRNLDKPGPNNPGFWAWRELNPLLCQRAAPAPRIRKEVDGESGAVQDKPVF